MFDSGAAQFTHGVRRGGCLTNGDGISGAEGTVFDLVAVAVFDRDVAADRRTLVAVGAVHTAAVSITRNRSAPSGVSITSPLRAVNVMSSLRSLVSPDTRPRPQSGMLR